MAVSRRFLNLLVPGCSPGIKSLFRLNLTHPDPDTPPPPPESPSPPGVPVPSFNKKKKKKKNKEGMDMIRLSGLPSYTLRASDHAWKMDCFPFTDSNLICTDQSGLGFVLDMGTRKVATMPPLLHKPRGAPIAVFVPKPKPDVISRFGDDSSSSSLLLLMERTPQPEPVSGGGGAQQDSEQFVGVIRHHPTIHSSEQSWHCYLLAPPPFVREPRHWDNNRRPEITAYGVVAGAGDGSHVCISVQGVGTYCLDTLSDTWSQVGEWTLPFRGKVEYDPELNLWFGLSADDGTHSLAAADLSHMDSSQSQSQPQLLLGPWKEFNPPKEWKECKEAQFVSLGAGRFCIARFFQAADAGLTGDDEGFAVLTGVEVNGRGKGGTQDVHQLQMTPHKSKRVNSGTSIEALF